MCILSWKDLGEFNILIQPSSCQIAYNSFNESLVKDRSPFH